MSLEQMWAELAPIGRDADSGGYHRSGWSPAERIAYEWFVDQCRQRGLDLRQDGVGNTVAWWHPHRSDQTGETGDVVDAVVTGSHLDSVPDGGAFDGPLGVVSALAAIDVLHERGFSPRRPIGVAVFCEEEGSRFGLPCLGSRLATGNVSATRLAGLRDRHGFRALEAFADAGLGVDATVSDEANLAALMAGSWLPSVGTFIELHVEQGRALALHGGSGGELGGGQSVTAGGGPVAVGTAIWPHGRWRLDVAGRADHAGTTAMIDRADPMLTAAFAVLAANKIARTRDARATVGRLEIVPGATNAVPSAVRAWLDARASDDDTLRALVEYLSGQLNERATRDGTTLAISSESLTPRIDFTADLSSRVAAVVAGALGHDQPTPMLPTAAGHDAGILAEFGIPTTMLFVRNPTGVSHSPEEHADLADCEAGVEALAAVLADLSAA